MIAQKSILVIDSGGLYSYVAQFLARYFGTVYYHKPTKEPYLRSPIAQIGKGLPGVEWVESPWKYIDKADMVFFPDCYDGDFQAWLYSHGYSVCGSGTGSKMELDKAYFMDTLKDVGLPIPKTEECEGLEDLWETVKDKEPGSCYLKNSEKHRGDWETKLFRNKHAFENYLNKKKQELGYRSEEMKILVQNKIDSECEIGIDTFMFNGQIPDNSALGYEIKDEGVIEKVFPELPKIIKDVDDKLAPIYKRLGYRGPYSLEIRITKEGKAFPIDATCRCGCPPTAVLCEMYGKSYAEALWSLAQGELPTLKPDAPYGAEIILASAWYRDNELHVGIPKELENNVKLKNAIKRGGEYYCIPNDPSGSDGVFGSVAATGKTWKEAAEKAMNMVKELDVDMLDYKENLFEEAEEQIASGGKFGIEF